MPPPRMREGATPEPLDNEGEPVLPQREPTPTEPAKKKKEPHIKLANAQEKLRLLRTGKARSTNVGMDMADVIEEAQQNRAAVLNDFTAASELIQMLSIHHARRRAVHLREMAELGRRIRLPSSWFSSERQQAITWYHVVQNLKLVHFDAGDVIYREGKLADRVFWFLGDKDFNRSVKQSADPEERPTSPMATPRSELQQAANVARHCKEGAPSTAQSNIAIWQGVGYEALAPTQQAYTSTVVASYKGSAAVLSRHDYIAINSMLQHTSFESLKGISMMLKAKQERTPQDLKDLAAMLSVFDLFNTMEEGMRQESAHLVEYMFCPGDFTLFEEGDKVDFNYVILQGSVRLSKTDEAPEIKTTGQQFGSMVQLVNGKKKRPFSATTETPCELAIMSRIVYSHVVQKHLQGVMQARSELLKSLASLEESSSSLQRIASYCADEVYPAGTAIVQPANFPYKVLIIMDGEAKEIWDPDDVNHLPISIDSVENARPLRNYQPRRLATRAKEKKKRPKSSAAAPGSDAGSSESGHPIAPGPRRHAVEVAKLGKGDIVNGLCLLGKAPQFHVVAHTKVKALSFETETCEVALGPQLYTRMCKLVQAKHNWCQDRVLRSLAVRKALGTNSIMAKESEDPVVRASAMAHFLDHYVPQGMQGAPSPGAKGRKSPKLSSVSLAPIAPTAPENGEDAHLPPEFSGIKSLVVRGKEPPPPPPVFPWHSNNSPSHHANFREAVAPASAEAAIASNAIMGSSTAASGMQAPSFMQELFMPSDSSNRESSKLHEEPWTGHPPSGWPSAEPLFAGQVCTTFLDLNTARTVRSVYARCKASSPKGKETSSRLCTPPKSPPPRSPLLQSSPNSQQATGGQHSPNQTSKHAAEVQQAERQGSPCTASRGGVVDSATSHRPARGASTGSLPHVLLPGLPGTLVLEERALNGALGVGQGAIAQRGRGGYGGAREHEKGDLSKSWAAGMGPGSRVESGLKGGGNTVHSSMDAVAALEAWSSSPVAGWRPGEQQQHAGGDPDLMANKGTLPHLPNAPSPMLVSENLKQRMLQKPASSFATARYVKKRTATLVSHGTSPDQERQAMPFPKAARPEAPLSSPPPHGTNQDGSVSGLTYHSSPSPAPPTQSHSSPGAPPVASATGTLHQNQAPAQRRSQAALGASLLKAPGGGGATALGLSDHGFDDEGVIILPHMMSIYDGVLDNERGFLKHASTDARSPHARWKGQTHYPPASAFQCKSFVQGLLDTKGGVLDDEGQQDNADDPYLAAQESMRSLQAMVSQNSVHKRGDPRPSLSSLASVKTLQRSSSKRADEPTLPLDRDAYAPPLQDHTISDPSHEDINYILHRWGARWQEERVEAIRRRQQRQLQQQLQEGRSNQVPILPPIREKAEGDRLTPESRLTPEFKLQEADLAAFGVPCVRSSRTPSFYDPDTPR